MPNVILFPQHLHGNHSHIIELVGESYRFRQRMHQEVDA
jgi:hypothetical protein